MDCQACQPLAKQSSPARQSKALMLLAVKATNLWDSEPNAMHVAAAHQRATLSTPRAAIGQMSVLGRPSASPHVVMKAMTRNGIANKQEADDGGCHQKAAEKKIRNVRSSSTSFTIANQ